MKELVLVFPHQLFEQHPAVKHGRHLHLVAEPLFFGDRHHPARFHRQKLLMHRLGLREYATRLRAQGHAVHEHGHEDAAAPGFLATIMRDADEVHVARVADHVLARRLQRAARETGARLLWHESPGFLLDHAAALEAVPRHGKCRQSGFYQQRRREMNLLMDGDKPVGGRWTYDVDNRRKLPKTLLTPDVPVTCLYAGGLALAREVHAAFPDNPGDATGHGWPITHTQARDWLHRFLDERLARFGDYQDAMRRGETFLFHAALSPPLNCGLITPREVVDHTLAHAATRQVPINALEGFLRQVVGWREYVRAVYEVRGTEQRTRNFFGFSNPMPSSLYDASTGIAPVDTVIRRVLRHGWCHHIERLMVLGNFMLLAEIHPDAVYRWFMELFVDAYDWVMVPNVYGMSQFADGGLMCTKPYVSGSAYLLRMSDFGKGDWCETWDGLFWRFVARHRALFETNPRTRAMTANLDRMDETRRVRLFDGAGRFLEQLHG